MSVTSLTGTTWVLNTSLTYSPFTFDGTNGKETYIYADVTSNGYQYTRIQVRDFTQTNTFYVRYRNDTSTTVYENGWVSEDYRTITFLGEPYRNPSVFYCATLAEAISWLEANAVQVVPDVAVSYKDTVIASTSITKTISLATAGTYCEDDITIEYNRPESPTPELQSKTVTPTESEQTVTADSGYDGLSEVTVEAIDSDYVGTGITRRSSSDLTVSGATVTAPAGFYVFNASKSVASGTAGTPTATKGTVSNNSVSVTPSVTNSTGYITGGTKTGTAVTVSASELVSGTKSITSSGTTDVTNYASASVASGSATTPATTITANPTISVSASGLITASVSKTQDVIPSVTAGYVALGRRGTITVNGSNTNQLTVYNGAHHQPTPSNYTVTVSLTNPINMSRFSDCTIRDLPTSDPYGSGVQIVATLNSPTSSTSVSIDSSHYGLSVSVSGASPSTYDADITCTGGVQLISNDNIGEMVFAVTGNGTITIDGIDYDD